MYAYSPLIINSGFRPTCGSGDVSCLEVLDNPVVGGAVSLQMHLILPWGVPLDVANELAYWIRSEPLAETTLSSSSDGSTFLDDYGEMSINSTSINPVRSAPAPAWACQQAFPSPCTHLSKYIEHSSAAWRLHACARMSTQAAGQHHRHKRQ